MKLRKDEIYYVYLETIQVADETKDFIECFNLKYYQTIMKFFILIYKAVLIS